MNSVSQTKEDNLSNRSVLNAWTIRAFNEKYFRIGAREAAATALVPAYPYFFRLDS
jgi:hypothetical protein